MSTVSIVRRSAGAALGRHSLFVAIALASIGWVGSGCLSPPAVVIDDLLEPVTRPTAWFPTEGDLAAANLARAALGAAQRSTPKSELNFQVDGDGSDHRQSSSADMASPAVEAALSKLLQIDLASQNRNLAALAIDLRNTTLDDPIRYRETSRRLRRRSGLDPRIRGRLDRTIGDDPVRLASRRQFDGWHRLWARTFNAVSEPLGSTLITGFVLAPFQLANSIAHYFADFSNSEPLSLTDRQALTLRKNFLAAHPTTVLTAELEKKVATATVLLEETMARRRLRAGQDALEFDEPSLALNHSGVALTTLAPHPDRNRRLRKRVENLQAKATLVADELSRRRRQSLGARVSPDGLAKADAALARSLLISPGNPAELNEQIARYREVAGNAGRGRVEFVLAIGQREQGFDFAARDRLAALAAIGPHKDSMARHAGVLIEDSWQNPYGAFQRLNRRAIREDLSWRLAGEWVRRTRYPNLPLPIAYLVDAPTIAMTIILSPLRALTSPWTGSPDFRRAPALAAYRYLVRFPGGAKQRTVIEWLYDYEAGQERWSRALVLADLMPEFDASDRVELVEKTAEQHLDRVENLDRRDDRASVLKGIAREFPDSEGGREAGLLFRAELEDASPQHIRITKSFLIENPAVAGRNGLGLNARLLNGDAADGELHPDGVLLRGGRVVEILLIADNADEDDLPEPRQLRISKQRLSQVASALDEAIQRNSLIDVGARQTASASRDVYLERAGLGLTEEVDQRPSAESNFVYQSLRERYGLVRGRDSLLPFDLVFRGSLGDFTLGAFPRWRPPRATPDAFLYR